MENETKKEWYTTKEFAEKIGISRRALNAWIFRHPLFIEKYCEDQNSPLAEKPRYLINHKGVIEYISQKSKTYHGNRFESGNDPISLERAKSDIAENALQNIEKKQNTSLSVSADPILANLQMMIEMRQNQLALDSKVENLEKKLNETLTVATNPIPATAGQRQFLNDRVRKYCIHHNLPFHVVWRQIHEHVGMASVHNYEFKHYQAALKYAEKMYIETGLIW